MKKQQQFILDINFIPVKISSNYSATIVRRKNIISRIYDNCRLLIRNAQPPEFGGCSGCVVKSYIRLYVPLYPQLCIFYP